VRVLLYEDLRSKGIDLSKSQIMRKVAEGKFPPPFRVTDNRNGWMEEVIDQYLVERSKAKPAASRAYFAKSRGR
jgi:predicted DNA-binding transcriptional regulator AlpA